MVKVHTAFKKQFLPSKAITPGPLLSSPFDILIIHKNANTPGTIVGVPPPELLMKNYEA